MDITDVASGLSWMNWSWVGLLALGAFHGVNPGMGWLFAVALGMQERRRAAVWRAMVPLAEGLSRSLTFFRANLERYL